jgi:hypothetical protein
MNDEIVTRLREHAQNCDCTNAEFDMDDAANEIERLHNDLAEVRHEYVKLSAKYIRAVHGDE